MEHMYIYIYPIHIPLLIPATFCMLRSSLVGGLGLTMCFFLSQQRYTSGEIVITFHRLKHGILWPQWYIHVYPANPDNPTWNLRFLGSMIFTGYVVL